MEHTSAVHGLQKLLGIDFVFSDNALCVPTTYACVWDNLSEAGVEEQCAEFSSIVSKTEKDARS